MRVPNTRNRMAGLNDLDQSSPGMETPADGFSMNADLRYLPYRSFPLFLGQLDELRQCKDEFRARYLTIPYQAGFAIPAYQTFDTGQRTSPGTIVWGLQFAALDGTPNDFRVQITDICSQSSFFSQALVASALRPSGVTDLYPVLIEPRCVSGGSNSGLKVEITNLAATSQRCQLVLMCAEPCSVQGSGPGAAPPFPWSYRDSVAG